VTADEYKRIWIQRGVQEDYAAFVSVKDVEISEGAEERAFNRADFVGKRTLREFVEAHKDTEAWRAV
jgi:hypothetical protein